MAYISNDAKNYGEALFLLTEELGETEQVKSDFKSLCTIIGENPKYLKLLDTPALSCDERVALIDEAFGSLNRNLVNLVKILAEKRLAHLISKVGAAFESYYDTSKGIERVEAITFLPLSEEQIDRLTKKLEKITNKQIIITNTIDSSILGGIKLRYLGIQVDGSLKTKLDKLETSLKELVI